MATGGANGVKGGLNRSWCFNHLLSLLSKDVWKQNFRQHGQLKSRDGKNQRREEKRRKKSREERRCGCANRQKVSKHCIFPMICGPGGPNSRLAKAVGAEPSGQLRDEKLHAIVPRSTFIWKSKSAKHLSVGAPLEVQMFKRVVVRSTCPRQHVQNAHQTQGAFGS